MHFRRVLLKVSGEAFSGESDSAYNEAALLQIVQEIAHLVKENVQVAIVVGAGNILRGRDVPAGLFSMGLSRVTADQMGMLGTIMNGLALRDLLEHQQDVSSELFAAHGVSSIVPTYSVEQAKSSLNHGKVVICAGGTGNPRFTTDSAACLRGIELGVEVVIKATQVDGVYDSDPAANPDAKRYDQLTFDEMIQNNLQVIDLTASTLCRENGMKVVVYKLKKKGALSRIVEGLSEGTTIQAD